MTSPGLGDMLLPAAAELAVPIRDALTPYLGTVAGSGTTMVALGPVAYHGGGLDLLVGDLAAAADHLRAAAENADALGATIWAASARDALEEALDRTGEGARAGGSCRGRGAHRERGLAMTR